ncbi:Asp-tRNA(Asn)/Glu-tRNA(Gln) amidotransferase A subunit family amidase [Cupriavidus gilardii J11]|uniref:Asp-tRNA(Asn)/Glu-tRNA(Gln) amidotransferase A subunit family amidase n=1 Tax=Cupriavidus gilardii J11 TaxID=936133 RepID=A0A562B2I2_9BURK|nr:Asp-tRNA(Asn)/Glu-tRNA(Gln) amidotransferase A subunit family amidase [Cupriavidus gilardii J11]
MTIKTTRAALSVAAALFVSQAMAAPFSLEEATVSKIHDAFRHGSLTCTQLVAGYLARIDAYNTKGPALRAILTVNPAALEQARALDAQYAANPNAAGSLHCIPLILKDNFDTADMPTSSGNVAMRDSRPQHDAFTVAKMRQAGALILAKSNLQEFARGGVSISSLGGQVLNPYDLTRNPGGSSGGTGAAIAANFAVMGTGSDTGQSIRSPSSANNLVGVRPTRGLISRTGVMPNSFTQDEIGPIARTVTDAARLLDVMVGFDKDDPITALGVGKTPRSYTDGLKADALKGARIGLFTDLMGSDARHAEVSAAMNRVAAEMARRGATVVRFSLPAYATLSKVVATDSFEAKPAFDKYFATLPANAPVKSFRQLVDGKTASPDIQKTLEKEIAIENGMDSDEYKTRMLNREKLRIALAGKMAELRIDAILYPMQSVLVTKAGDANQPERNGTLSNGTGFPAVTFQAGFSAPTADAPLGVPIGAELLGLDYTEPKLLAYAYAFEQATHLRRPPLSTPALK